jgi:hypothetical protein
LKLLCDGLQLARQLARALIARADRQHAWIMAGDDRGLYGTEGAELMHRIRSL